MGNVSERKSASALQREASFDQVNVSLPIFVERDAGKPKNDTTYSSVTDRDAEIRSGFGIRTFLKKVIKFRRGKPAGTELKPYKDPHWAVDVTPIDKKALAQVLAPADMDVLFVGRFDGDSGLSVVARVRADGSLLSTAHMESVDPNVVPGTFLAARTVYGIAGVDGRATGRTVHTRWRLAPDGATVLAKDASGKENVDLIGNLLERMQDPYFSFEKEIIRAQSDIRNYRDAEISFYGKPAKLGTFVAGATPLSSATHVAEGAEVVPSAIGVGSDSSGRAPLSK